VDRTGIVSWIFLALWLFVATQVDIDPEPRARNDPTVALSPRPHQSDSVNHSQPFGVEPTRRNSAPGPAAPESESESGRPQSD